MNNLRLCHILAFLERSLYIYARYSSEMFYLNIILMFNFIYKLDWHPEYINNWSYLILNVSVKMFLDINIWIHRKEKDWLSQCGYSYSGNSRLDYIKGLTATDQGWNRRWFLWFLSQTKISALLASFSLTFQTIIFLSFKSPSCKL